ncbi:hypothetical protein [Dactylosporangium sp. CA-092794]|uniref:hypothetical protein n=1 Tax=Dactylosporangium sp. CA-092794 TaxID=3239929 RepID=UPI003D89D030
MLSQLFAGDPLLQAIAEDRDRISRTRHADDPAVAKVQAALLLWDPGALPVYGADGRYGGECAAAVHRFKRDELGVAEGDIVDDIGPGTVERLDQIARAAEEVAALGFVFVAAPQATDADLDAVLTLVTDTGGDVLLGLGDRAAAVVGGPATGAALGALVGTTLAGIVTPDAPEPPPGTDPGTAALIAVWAAQADPAFILAQADPARFGVSFVALGDCFSEEELG